VTLPGAPLAPELEPVDILLVDDQPANLVALAATLERPGQRLHRAGSGREALRLLLEHDFAVILLDVLMPGMDGFETAALIRERERSSRTPIVFLTALREREPGLLQAYQLGAVDYLIKPFVPEILRSKVAVFVDLARKTEQMRRAAQALRDAEHLEHLRALREAEQRFEAERLRAREQVLQRQMEAGLNQQRWLEAILDGLPTALVLLDPAVPGGVFANRAAQALAGGALTVAAPPSDGTRILDGQGSAVEPGALPLTRAAQGERLAGLQLDFRCPDGRRGSVLAYSERLGPLAEHPETVLLSLLDVSELRRTQLELEDAVRAREDFLAVASHELRTPLTALKIQLANAVRSWGRPEVASDPAGHAIGYLEQLQRSVGRLVRLTDYLLDVSGLGAGSVELRPASVELGALVLEAVERLREELAAAGCEVRFSPTTQVLGRWDARRLEQAVTNLLTNALKYAPGRPIELDVHSDGEQAWLVVRDHGQGIAAEVQARLFQRFARAGEPGDGRGFGLGLWIVSQIVELHGGAIQVESARGAGTTFTLRLPCEGRRPERRGAPPPLAAATAHRALQGGALR